eukprot:TRINITY_DN2047_c0_g1_i2.p1 TRINITY_DN2047_c0_g1~~TRINITY_DN2047_c0_g1_i2.p1  ORF type:complete len:379 (-),score=48.87 TRINITY_DN2047_c0_g1_i2:91-1227(-)
MCIRDRLYLYWMRYQGDINETCTIVLQILGKVNLLQQLNLFFNGTQFNDIGCKALALLLQRSFSLTHLTIIAEATSITGLGVELIGEGLVRAKQLNKLELNFSIRNNSICDGAVASIARSLNNQESLSDLKLQFSGAFSAMDVMPKALGDSLQRLTTITQLNLQLGREFITEDGYHSLFEGISQLSLLTSLILNFDESKSVSERTCSLLPKILSQLHQLEILNLSFFYCNRIDDKALGLLGEALAARTAITHLSLNLSWLNLVGDVGVEALSQGINSLLHLSALTLSLSRSGVTDIGVSHLINSLASHANLSEFVLALDNCEGVTDESAKVILGFLMNGPTLKEFELFICNTGITFEGKALLGDPEIPRFFDSFRLSI